MHSHRDMTSLPDREEEVPFWAPSMSSSNDLSQSPENCEQGVLPRSWCMSTSEVTKALVPLAQLDDLPTTSGGSSENSKEAGNQFSFAMSIDPGITVDRSKATSDLYPLIPKQNSGLPNFGCGSYSPVDETSISTPKRLEELKNWLWLQQERSPELDMGGCFHVKWFHGGLGPFRSFLRKTLVKRLFRDSKEKRKEKLILQNAQMQAALSVAGVAAAIAAIAAATAASAGNERASRTDVAVASAAALVAAQCADVAENMGADHDRVASAINSATNVKSTAEILKLTAAATTFLRGAAILRENSQKEARVHAIVSPLERRSSALSGNTIFQDAEAEYGYHKELLAKGCEFLVRSKNGKLHRRLAYLSLDTHKRVILKLRSRHMAGAFSKTHTRVVSDILLDITAWPGRSLLHDGEEKCYFGLQTSREILEFECKNDFDYHLWTEGICNLLSLRKKCQPK